MAWTSELPKADGYYWWRESADTPEVVQVWMSERKRPEYWFERDGEFLRIGRDVYKGGEWCGPLKPPE